MSWHIILTARSFRINIIFRINITFFKTDNEVPLYGEVTAVLVNSIQSEGQLD